ncbi:hypothetical protein GE061_003870 [Apolygus lucorum]|uniref:Uncharacterized protein n=1 Tax=Apolygus lucorum TaxID=248454 RepID=A0A8S9WZ36_APOLU|nr:hypothetical protein GE061_003870 [Apolygus lucorum]
MLLRSLSIPYVFFMSVKRLASAPACSSHIGGLMCDVAKSPLLQLSIKAVCNLRDHLLGYIRHLDLFLCNASHLVEEVSIYTCLL